MSIIINNVFVTEVHYRKNTKFIAYNVGIVDNLFLKNSYCIFLYVALTVIKLFGLRH